MQNIIDKFSKLKTSIGGNRERFRYEDTFGMPKEEQAHITPPNRANTRIISELEFAIKLSQVQDSAYEEQLHHALDFLLDKVATDGVLTNQACEQAESILSPMESATKEYEVILVGHAHIDMNWMWSYNETVAATLATFRTVLDIMRQYPDFCFSQSQAAVYKIVEEYDPAMMEEIKRYISEGRWEVTATAWVEPDKNLPDTESMLRHIQYTREYLENSWGARNFEIDFVPDTFGHHANVSEIDRFGQVKYMYHCRGLREDYVLYRYRAPSGKEILVYREPNWYNGAITPHLGSGLLEILNHCAGLKTGLTVYGVGDHGGGPTRRDIERALDMMTWKIYPRLRFGTLHEYFHKAETVLRNLPVVERELNFFAPGCYTTQSRIKRGNRNLERAFSDTESISAMAHYFGGFQPAFEKMREAWQEVLFNNFHDILTGSCVQDSREHAMGLYQHASAVNGSQTQQALASICEKIDTSSILYNLDSYYSQSEGAGGGYGLEDFRGVPSPERGGGITRIFHIFNSMPLQRRQVMEISVWDWIGDLRRIQVEDTAGNEIMFQLVDNQLQQYWDHKYFRILVDVDVLPFGYTTIVLSQAEPKEYIAYLQKEERVSKFYDDYVLRNEFIEVVIASDSGRISSIREIASGKEMIAPSQTAGLVYLETETMTSNAWQIGRTLRALDVDRCVSLKRIADGEIRQQVQASYLIESSKIDITYTLDAHSMFVKIDMTIDWHEIGETSIPVLTYNVPLSYKVDHYQYDIPAGSICRQELHNDVPGLTYGIAVSESEARSVMLSCDSKYGYRGEDGNLSLTLINSSTSPDPYPERGIHAVSIFLGVTDCAPKKAKELSYSCNHPLIYQSGYRHSGNLQKEGSFLSVESETVVVSSVNFCEDGGYHIRVYETSGNLGQVALNFHTTIHKAVSVDLFGKEQKLSYIVDGTQVKFQVAPYSLAELKVTL